MEEISLSSKILFNIGPMPVSNTMIATWLAILVIAIVGIFVKINIKKVPGTLQNIFEMAIEYLLDLADNVTQDREKSKLFLPWVTTFFFFILFANWMELIPGFSSIGIEEIVHGKHEFVPILRSANTDLNTTLALALLSMVLVQIFGMYKLGFFKYLGKFFTLKGPIDFFVGILELISEISKIVSFSFRLFGNIFAGEVLLVVIAFLIPYVVPVPFYAMEIFVGAIQALVFSMLSLVFMNMATASHDEH